MSRRRSDEQCNSVKLIGPLSLQKEAADGFVSSVNFGPWYPNCPRLPFSLPSCDIVMLRLRT